MNIDYSSTQLEELCNTKKQLHKTFGENSAKKIRRRLDNLRSAPNLEEMRGLPGGCHELQGNRKGQLAVDVGNGKRLVFEVANDPPPVKDDGGLNWVAVTAIKILEIVNYHD